MQRIPWLPQEQSATSEKNEVYREICMGTKKSRYFHKNVKRDKVTKASLKLIFAC
jgi:hypothetical protein